MIYPIVAVLGASAAVYGLCVSREQRHRRELKKQQREAAAYNDHKTVNQISRILAGLDEFDKRFEEALKNRNFEELDGFFWIYSKVGNKDKMNAISKILDPVRP